MSCFKKRKRLAPAWQVFWLETDESNNLIVSYIAVSTIKARKHPLVGAFGRDKLHNILRQRFVLFSTNFSKFLQKTREEFVQSKLSHLANIHDTPFAQHKCLRAHTCMSEYDRHFTALSLCFDKCFLFLKLVYMYEIAILHANNIISFKDRVRTQQLLIVVYYPFLLAIILLILHGSVLPSSVLTGNLSSHELYRMGDNCYIGSVIYFLPDSRRSVYDRSVLPAILKYIAATLT